MNGYLHNGNYYGIMCPGDSGGPDPLLDGAVDVLGIYRIDRPLMLLPWGRRRMRIV